MRSIPHGIRQSISRKSREWQSPISGVWHCCASRESGWSLSSTYKTYVPYVTSIPHNRILFAASRDKEEYQWLVVPTKRVTWHPFLLVSTMHWKQRRQKVSSSDHLLIYILYLRNVPLIRHILTQHNQNIPTPHPRQHKVQQILNS